MGRKKCVSFALIFIVLRQILLKPTDSYWSIYFIPACVLGKVWNSAAANSHVARVACAIYRRGVGFG